MKFYLQSDDCCSVCDGEGLVRSKDPLHRTPSDNDIKFALGVADGQRYQVCPGRTSLSTETLRLC